MGNDSRENSAEGLLERFRHNPKALEDNTLFERLLAALGMKPNQALGLWTCLRRPGWRSAANPVQYLKERRPAGCEPTMEKGRKAEGVASGRRDCSFIRGR